MKNRVPEEEKRNEVDSYISRINEMSNLLLDVLLNV